MRRRSVPLSARRSAALARKAVAIHRDTIAEGSDGARYMKCLVDHGLLSSFTMDPFAAGSCQAASLSHTRLP